MVEEKREKTKQQQTNAFCEEKRRHVSLSELNVSEQRDKGWTDTRNPCTRYNPLTTLLAPAVDREREREREREGSTHVWVTGVLTLLRWMCTIWIKTAAPPNRSHDAQKCRLHLTVTGNSPGFSFTSATNWHQMNLQSHAEKYLLHKTAKRSLFALFNNNNSNVK